MVARIEYVACPLCGMNKVIVSAKRAEKGKSDDWVNFDVSTMRFIQIREGGGKTGTGKKGRGRGKGVGFHLVDSDTLEDCVRNNHHMSLVAQMAQQLVKIVKEAKSLGIITDADLK